jgi:hypothetical protein
MIKGCSKKGYEFGFTWIFTIFVGATVIFLAIYIATQIVNTERTGQSATEGKSLGILLTPIETETEEGKFAKIILTDETRIYHECEYPESTDPFGSNNLQMSVKPIYGGEWGNPNAPSITFHNKYFFPSASQSDRLGTYASYAKENYYVLSKPLYLPFKVADLLIIWSDQEEFCFLNAPTEVKSRLEPLDMDNVYFQSPRGYTCDPSTQKTVCFSGSCDVRVYENNGFVRKEGKDLYYVESQEHDPYSMMYAAIFSNPEIYTCQAARLMVHTSKLIDLYLAKSIYISSPARSSGCSQRSQPTMLTFNNTVSVAAEAIKSTGDSAPLSNVMAHMETSPNFQELKNYNGGINCALF